MPTYTRLGISRICSEDTYLTELKPLGYAPVKEKTEELLPFEEVEKIEVIEEVSEIPEEIKKVATPRKGGRPKKK
jgi:hypothetical protein